MFPSPLIEKQVSDTRAKVVKELIYLHDVLKDPKMARYDDKRRKKEYAEIVLGSDALKSISSVCFEFYKEVENGSKKTKQDLATAYVNSLDYLTLQKLSVILM